MWSLCRRRSLACVLAAAGFGAIGVSEDKGEAALRVRRVVKADDMGAAHAINAGTIVAHERGVVTATDVIVPGPWLMDAMQLLAEHPRLDAGVHRTLTSEWDRVKWRPLTPEKRFVDANGCFFPMTGPSRSFPPGSSLFEEKPDLVEVERELRALTERLAKEYGLPLQDSIPGLTWRREIFESTDSAADKARKLAARLEALVPGDYAFLDHAALDTPEMRAIGHEGYRGVAEDRAANVSAWTSDVVREAVRRRGIELVTLRQLIDEKGLAKRKE